MANVLTGLIPSLFAGLDDVSREAVGYIPAVRRDAKTDRAAVGQAVTYPITPAGNGVNITPSMTIPEPTDQTIGTDSVIITKAKAYEFGFVGEEQLALDNNGPGFSLVQADMFAQAMRGLINEIETDIAVAAIAGASRAYGTPGTSPFATNMAALSQLNKILTDNGAATTDRNLVLNTGAGADLRTLFSINSSRDTAQTPFAQQGVIINQQGVNIRETGYSSAFVAGTAASGTTDTTGYAKGARTITLASAGTGSFLVGDVVSFAGDPEKYVLTAGDASIAGGGTITIASPGLRRAIPAAATAITVSRNSDTVPTYTPAGVLFTKNSIVLAARAPALVNGRDAAIDSMMMTDPRSGLPLEIRVYAGYGKMRYEVRCAWGVKVTQARHTALLIS